MLYRKTEFFSVFRTTQSLRALWKAVETIITTPLAFGPTGKASTREIVSRGVVFIAEETPRCAHTLVVPKGAAPPTVLIRGPVFRLRGSSCRNTLRQVRVGLGLASSQVGFSLKGPSRSPMRVMAPRS